MTADPWKCSKFSPGSLAERCAKDPGFFILILFYSTVQAIEEAQSGSS
ncbi:MAG: hypothetical protein WB815_10185 [Nitrososphaeraceae archaeon]